MKCTARTLKKNVCARTNMYNKEMIGKNSILFSDATLQDIEMIKFLIKSNLKKARVMLPGILEACPDQQ